MSVDVETLGIVVELKNGQLVTRSLDEIGAKGDKAQHSLEGIRSVVEDVKRSLEALGLTVGALELLKMANEAREAAEQYQKLGVITQQLGAEHGATAEQIRATEAALEHQGTSMSEARDAVVSLLTANVDLANASRLMAVAQDLAAVSGLNEGEAMRQLVIAVENGVDRSLRQAGVQIDLAKAVTQTAAAMGVSVDQMSIAQQQQIRLNAVLAAGTQLHGAHAAALKTEAGQAAEAASALSDLKIIAGSVLSSATEGMAQKYADDLKSIVTWARANPAELARMADAIRAVAVAVGVGAAAFGLMKTAALAASGATAILAGAETVTAFISLAKTVESAADAFALLGIAAEAVNPIALIASIAAITGGIIAWKHETADLKAQTDALSHSLNGAGALGGTPGGGGGSGNTTSSIEALTRLAQMKETFPALIDGLRAVGDAYAHVSAPMGAVEEHQAQLTQTMQEATKGLVDNARQQAIDLVNRKDAAQQYADQAKHLRDVIDAGYQETHDAELQANQVLAIGNAVQRMAINYDAATKILQAHKEMAAASTMADGDAKTAALAAAQAEIDAANKVRQFLLKALAVEEMKAPWINLVTGIDDGIQSFSRDLATRPADAFRNMTDTIRGLWGNLIADLEKQEFEKHVLPKLAAAFGIDSTGNGDVVESGLGMFLEKHRAELGAAGAGFGLGSALGSAVGSGAGGAALGAAAGAAQGAMVAGPMGAFIGGISGLVGGFLSGSSAAEKLAQSTADMQRQFQISLLTFEQAAGDATDLQVALAKLDETTQQLEAQAIDAGGVWGIISGDTIAQLTNIADKEKLRNQQLQEQAELDKKTQQESLQARLLRAQGDDAAADALDLQVQHEQERLKLVQSFGSFIDPTEKATLALYDQVAAQEKVKQATDALTNANENLAGGLKLNLDLFKFSPALGPGDTPGFTPPPLPTPPTTGGRPSPTQQYRVEIPVALDGKIITRVVVADLQEMAQAQYGTTDRWSEVVVDT